MVVSALDTIETRITALQDGFARVQGDVHRVSLDAREVEMLSSVAAVRLSLESAALAGTWPIERIAAATVLGAALGHLTMGLLLFANIGQGLLAGGAAAGVVCTGHATVDGADGHGDGGGLEPDAAVCGGVPDGGGGPGATECDAGAGVQGDGAANEAGCGVDAGEGVPECCRAAKEDCNRDHRGARQLTG
jgi:hypothetical protein